jgi:glucose-6-phosphate 1-dehydrogenase
VRVIGFDDHPAVLAADPDLTEQNSLWQIKELTMAILHADALVFFGAAGDLAHKKIFSALKAMLKRCHLDVPVIGVAKAGWNLEQLRARAHDSLGKHGGVDAVAFDKLSGLLRYVQPCWSSKLFQRSRNRLRDR